MPEPVALPAAVAGGIGSLPGTDVAEAMRLSFGELPDFPALPELPQRGPGAELIGRTAALLVDLPVQLYAGRWQLASRRGIDLRRSTDLLERDLDVLTDLESGHNGPVKIAAAGPWTLSTSLHRQMGGPMLADAGAVRELAASLAEGLAAHVSEVAARLPHASIVVQLDEPSLPAVLAGDIPTDSGLARHRPVEADLARQVLAAVLGAVAVPTVVHCCAPQVPVALVRSAGASAVSMDLSLLDMDAPASIDPLGEALDAGFVLFAGVVPSSGDDEEKISDVAAAEQVTRLWSRIGLSRQSLRRQVVVTPTCGLATVSPARARAVLMACRESAKRLAD